MSRCLCLMLICLFAVSSTHAAEEDGFKPLFNGKDLTGWKGINIADDTFTVKDDMIICSGLPIGLLRTEKMYRNFILELEWRHMRPGGNSGLFVWSDAITAKGQPFSRSIECQVLDGKDGASYTVHGDVFAIHGATWKPDNPRKSDSRAYPTENRSKPSPEWNHYRIECIDGAIKLAVNGKVVTTGSGASPRMGHIVLESEGGLVHFKNIRIKELPAQGELDAKDIAQEYRNFVCQYDGKSFAGWKAPASWKARDWIMHHEGAKEGDGALVHDKVPASTELIVDLRSTAAVGVMYAGVTLTVPPMEKGNPWRRLHAKISDGKLITTIDDKPLGEAKAIVDVKAPLQLTPSGTADFANVYLREVK